MQLWNSLYGEMFKSIKDESDIEVLSYELSALHDCFQALEQHGLNEEVLRLVTAIIVELLSDYEER